MNLSQLRAFDALANEGSFTRAARVLRLTQPTVSGHIQGLESTYEVPLVDRSGRRPALTPTGRALHEISARLFALEAEAERLLSGTQRLLTGHLRIGADSPHHVTNFLREYRERHPGVALSISTGSAAQVLSTLHTRKSDVVIIGVCMVDDTFKPTKAIGKEVSLNFVQTYTDSQGHLMVGLQSLG